MDVSPVGSRDDRHGAGALPTVEGHLCAVKRAGVGQRLREARPIDACPCRDPTYRHPREGGDPGLHRDMTLKSPDVRLRRSKAKPAFAGMTGCERRGELVHQAAKPAASLRSPLSLRNSLCRCKTRRVHAAKPTVIPAKAGIQGFIAK